MIVYNIPVYARDFALIYIPAFIIECTQIWLYLEDIKGNKISICVGNGSYPKNCINSFIVMCEKQTGPKTDSRIIHEQVAFPPH